jgi:hypothetical protein
MLFTEPRSRQQRKIQVSQTRSPRPLLRPVVACAHSILNQRTVIDPRDEAQDAIRHSSEESQGFRFYKPSFHAFLYTNNEAF